MIVTVTLNPALDKTLTINQLKLGESNCIMSYRYDPGGKGLNVSRIVNELGRDTVALGFLGGDIGLHIRSALDRMGLKHDFVEIPNNTRTNISLLDVAKPPATEFNDPGPQITEEELLELEARLLKYLKNADLVVFAGSIPPGLPTDTYQRLIHLVEQRGKLTVLDASGAAMIQGIKETPYFIKPNRYEASKLLGRELSTKEEVIQAGKDLLNDGIKVVGISMGKEGTILVTDSEVWQAYPVDVPVKSGVGAGDSLVAGICIGIVEKLSWPEALKLGTAAASASCMQEGTQLGKKNDIIPLIEKVRVERLA